MHVSSIFHEPTVGECTGRQGLSCMSFSTPEHIHLLHQESIQPMWKSLWASSPQVGRITEGFHSLKPHI